MITGSHREDDCALLTFLSSRPNYPAETTEEESVMEDDAELTLSRVEEEMIVGVLKELHPSPPADCPPLRQLTSSV